MNKEHAQQLIVMLVATAKIMTAIENAGGKDVYYELDENEAGYFTDIWAGNLLGGKTIAYVGLENGKLVITNNMTYQQTNMDELLEDLSFGISQSI